MLNYELQVPIGGRDWNQIRTSLPTPAPYSGVSEIDGRTGLVIYTGPTFEACRDIAHATLRKCHYRIVRVR
jgi:hypothetical protein